ncbi:MAG TPA: type II toxin-antitoxin system VapC family toxin [Rhizomicrobium sp.]|jgi:PIN domain nuclease of toxin-antitoxin system|nr:type II toxin-antitoxin system VapC family toxin [Rhizomicrobium sp.]
MRHALLLDTCALIWIMNNDDLSATAVQYIDEAYDQGEAIYASPITAWEIGLQALRGRFRSNLTPQRWLEELLRTPNVKVAELTPRVLLESSFLPGSPPRDPADRIVIATAREFALTVVTRDRALLDYANEGYLNAIAC